MDDIELATLRNELHEDCNVVQAAGQLAQERFDANGPASLEACAYHLARLYNVIEQMARRVARLFENSIDDDRGWHAELIRRMTIEIGGVRPALFSRNLADPLRELRAFRHLVTHAYDLTLDPDKLRLLLKYAGQVVGALPAVADTFIQGVSSMHGLTPPDVKQRFVDYLAEDALEQALAELRELQSVSAASDSVLELRKLRAGE